MIRMQWAMRRIFGWKPLSDGDQRLVALGYEVHNMNELLKTLLQSNGNALDGVGQVAERVIALERKVKAVEDAPAAVAWTGMCIECGNTIEDGDRITWRLRWSPQGPIHEECR